MAFSWLIMCLTWRHLYPFLKVIVFKRRRIARKHPPGNPGRINNFLLRRSEGFYHYHVEQHDWVCPADTSLVFLASETPFPVYISFA